MLLLRFYRLYISFAAGAAVYFGALHSIWSWLGTVVIFRALWLLIERKIQFLRMNRWFQKHSYEFKQQLGPYGIRMINKAESDIAIKRNLAEVFTPDLKSLKATFEQLEIMDTLFRSGMRPEGDTYQLHDLKLKYARYRLEKAGIT